MGLSSSDANKQVLEEFKKAGIDCPIDTKTLLTELTHKITILGKRESRHDMMCEQTKVTIDRILEDNKEKLGPHAEKICEILENTAPNDKAKEALQAKLASTKSQYMPKEKTKSFEESLDLVQETVIKLGNSQSVRNLMGDANADKLAGMAQKMDDRLKGVTDQSKRAEILVNEIGKMNKFVENAEKQASKGKFGKVMNVLKSALKVIGTLGLNKNAKLEFAAAKFAMNSKNAEKIKASAKAVSEGLQKSAQVASNAKKINTNKGMSR